MTLTVVTPSSKPINLVSLWEDTESEQENTLKFDPEEWEVIRRSIPPESNTVSECDKRDQKTAQKDPTPSDDREWSVVWSRDPNNKQEPVEHDTFMKFCESVHILVCKIAQSISSFFCETPENLSLSLSIVFSGPCSIIGRRVTPFRKFQNALQYI